MLRLAGSIILILGMGKLKGKVKILLEIDEVLTTPGIGSLEAAIK